MSFSRGKSSSRPQTPSRHKPNNSSNLLNATALGESFCITSTSELKTQQKKLVIENNKYYKEMLKKKIINNIHEEISQKCNDVLIKQKKQLTLLQCEEVHLKSEVEKIALNKLIIGNMSRLQTTVTHTSNLLNQENIEEEILEISNVLQEHANKLLVRGIEPIKNQDDYDNLEKILQAYSKHLVQLKEKAGNTQCLNELPKQLALCLELNEKLNQENNELSGIEESFIKKMIVCCSDMLTNT